MTDALAVPTLSGPSGPHRVATLLYCFNHQDEVLLLQRTREPNRGLWSPPGGKLRLETGESPYASACREAGEEMALQIGPRDLHLTGLVSECGYGGQAHWLMFLFEVKPRLSSLPAIHEEGTFAFYPADRIAALPLPRSDREQLWPLFWRHRGGYFAAACLCGDGGQDRWSLEESISPAISPPST